MLQSVLPKCFRGLSPLEAVLSIRCVEAQVKEEDV